MKKDFDDFDMTPITKILMHIQSYLYNAITNTILNTSINKAKSTFSYLKNTIIKQRTENVYVPLKKNRTYHRAMKTSRKNSGVRNIRNLLKSFLPIDGL